MGNELERARRFLDDCEEWFPKMRDVYKERLARIFEDQPNETEIEKIGAKLAVMRELQRDLTTMISDADVQEGEQ